MNGENVHPPPVPECRIPPGCTRLSILRVGTNIGIEMKPAERWKSVEELQLVHSAVQRSDPILPKYPPSATPHQDPSIIGTHEIAPLGYHLFKRSDYSLRYSSREQRIKSCGIQLVRYSSPDGNAFGHSGRISYAAGKHLTNRLIDPVGASSKK